MVSDDNFVDAVFYNLGLFVSSWDRIALRFDSLYFCLHIFITPLRNNNLFVKSRKCELRFINLCLTSQNGAFVLKKSKIFYDFWLTILFAEEVVNCSVDLI